MSILAHETDRYTDVWLSLPAYRKVSPGLELLPIFLGMATPPASVLDVGCGTGKAGVALADAGFEVTLADLTTAGLTDEAKRLPFKQACLWHALRPQLRIGQVDWIYCVDVLEHVPCQFTMLAIEQMLRLANGAVFLGVSLTPDQHGVWTGAPLHLTVQPFTWWRDSLKELGTVKEARDLITHGVYVVSR